MSDALAPCGARRAAAAARRGANGWPGRLKAAVDFGQIDELIGRPIDGFLTEITRQCEQIHEAVYACLYRLWRGNGALKPGRP